MSMHNLPSQLQGPQTSDTQFKEDTVLIVKDNQINILNEDVQSTEESKTEKVEIKWPPKHKINKQKKIKRLNAKIHNSLCPKSPLEVFNEVYKYIPIKLDETSFGFYTASIEFEGHVFNGAHSSKIQAKQIVCEEFLRIMLTKKMTEAPEAKKEVNGDREIEKGEMNTSIKPYGVPQDDFPWPHFISLALYKLIGLWDLKNIAKDMQNEPAISAPIKDTSMNRLPANPEKYHPVQLLYRMYPGINFCETTSNIGYDITVEINNVVYSGQGSSKKAAKKECAIQAIKYIWDFDYDAIGK